MRILVGCMALLLMSGHRWAQDRGAPGLMKSSSILTNFQVVEFGRYTIRDGDASICPVLPAVDPVKGEKGAKASPSLRFCRHGGQRRCLCPVG
jgi:hypothetical protein